MSEKYLDEDVKRYLDSIEKYIKAKYQLPPADADEIKQEIALALARTNYENHKIHNKDAYARAVSHSKLIEYFRSKKRILSLNQLVDMQEGGEYAETLPGRRPEGLAEVLESEGRDTVFRAIGALPDELRRLVIAIYFEGMKPDDVAKIEGTKVKTLYYRLQCAHKLLMNHLKEYYSTMFRAHKRRTVDKRAREQFQRFRRDIEKRLGFATARVLELHIMEGIPADELAAEVTRGKATPRHRREVREMLERGLQFIKTEFGIEVG